MDKSKKFMCFTGCGKKTFLIFFFIFLIIPFSVQAGSFTVTNIDCKGFSYEISGYEYDMSFWIYLQEETVTEIPPWYSRFDWCGAAPSARAGEKQAICPGSYKI